MNKVEIFILRDCPYCVKARKAVDELMSDSDNYSRVPIDWIDESEEVDYASEHNYYYVPSVYYEGKKFFEARPGDSLEKKKKEYRLHLIRPYMTVQVMSILTLYTIECR